MHYYGGVGGVGGVGGGYTGECKPNRMHRHESPRKNVYDDNKKNSNEVMSPGTHTYESVESSVRSPDSFSEEG
eukprot:5584525-Ditylum_brightwellii.AAC.1